MQVNTLVGKCQMEVLAKYQIQAQRRAVIGRQKLIQKVSIENILLSIIERN